MSLQKKQQTCYKQNKLNQEEAKQKTNGHVLMCVAFYVPFFVAFFTLQIMICAGENTTKKQHQKHNKKLEKDACYRKQNAFQMSMPQRKQKKTMCKDRLK